VGLYVDGKLTQGEAARLAGRSREAFLEVLAKRGAPFTNITPEDLDEELEYWHGTRSMGACR
jgi:predicted HTH domain antitoxin